MQPLTLLVPYKTKPGMMMPFVESSIDAGLLDTIRAEDGCLRYDYYFPAVPANEVLLVEVWESAEHQAAHMAQPHMAQLAAMKATFVADTHVEKLTTL